MKSIWLVWLDFKWVSQFDPKQRKCLFTSMAPWKVWTLKTKTNVLYLGYYNLCKNSMNVYFYGKWVYFPNGMICVLYMNLFAINGDKVQRMLLVIFCFLTTFGWVDMNWVTLTPRHYRWQTNRTGGFSSRVSYDKNESRRVIPSAWLKKARTESLAWTNAVSQ